MVRLPPLNALRAFEAAARNLSFKQAADELCVTQGSISRHIANLEQYLGVALFLRKHRRVELTAEGDSYMREVQDALLRISHATTALAASKGRDTLSIKTPPTSAIWWLVPRLGRFHARHPAIQVQLTTSHLPVDFEGEDVDVALQYGPPANERLISERLFGEVLIPICSRGLLETAGPFSRPSDLAGQVLLHSIRRPSDWREWFEAAKLDGFNAEQVIVFENSALTYQGAIDGVGIALAQLAFVAEELASGKVVTPLDFRLSNQTGYYLVVPPQKERLFRVRAFREWVGDEARLTRAADPAL